MCPSFNIIRAFFSYLWNFFPSKPQTKNLLWNKYSPSMELAGWFVLVGNFFGKTFLWFLCFLFPYLCNFAGGQYHRGNVKN